MPETPLNWLQTKYVLSHELGHLYGRYNEEYNWAAWYYQTYGLTLKGITFKVSGLKNAENEFGNIDFPICCKKYVCCADKYSNVGPPIDIRWEPIFKCPNSQSKKFPITIQLEDSLCSNKPKPKDAYSLNAVGCGKTNSEWLICSGTPYIDSRGMQPNVELLSSEPSPNYYSVMGSPIFDLDRVYPEPSVCPLKCPD